MNSVVRSVSGAAFLLLGTSAAMAQSANPPAAASGSYTSATTTTSAPNAGVPAAAAPAAAPQKPRTPAIADNTDPTGGQDPNSTAAMRAFFTPAY